MERNTSQAKHNEEFFSLLKEKLPHSFYDWKLTVVFYAALHYVKAFSIYRGIDIGDTHFDMMNSIFPKDGSEPKLKLPKEVRSYYKTMYRYSRACRYDGFLTIENFNRICEANLNYSLSALDKMKAYFKSQGLFKEKEQRVKAFTETKPPTEQKSVS